MRLKTIPEDFIVVEIANHDVKIEETSERYYALFEMTKRNMTTERALSMIADVCGVPRKHLGYAGTKDARAVTKQYITARIEHPETLDRLKNFSRPPMLTIRHLGFVYDPLGLGRLERNRFEIVVRDISEERISPLSRIPNFFDEQRFSKANAQIGELLVKKDYRAATELLIKTDDDAGVRLSRTLDERPNDFITALRLIPKNILLLYVHAYQSLLWNEVLSRYILENDPAARIVEGPLKLAVPSIDLERVSIPLYGFGTENDLIFGAWYEDILAREGIEPRDFVNRQLPFLTVEGGGREAFFEVGDLDIGLMEDDDLHSGKKKQRLAFSLPKGCYATMVVKCLYGVGDISGKDTV